MCKDLLVNKATTRMGYIRTEQSVALQITTCLSFTADFLRDILNRPTDSTSDVQITKSTLPEQPRGNTLLDCLCIT